MSWSRTDDRVDRALEVVSVVAGLGMVGMTLATAWLEMRRAQFELAKSMMGVAEFEEEDDDGEEDDEDASAACNC